MLKTGYSARYTDFNPVGLNVHNKLFQLAYWNSVDVAEIFDHLVYKMINQKPTNIDVINGFATYLFDTLLVVPTRICTRLVWFRMNHRHCMVVWTETQTLIKKWITTRWILVYIASAWFLDDSSALWRHTQSWDMLIGIDDPTSPTIDIRMSNPVQHEFTLDFIMKAGKNTSVQFSIWAVSLLKVKAVSGNRFHT